MYAEVVGEKLSAEFGKENVRDAWQMHDCQADSLAAYLELMKGGAKGVETSGQFQFGNGQPGTGSVYVAAKEMGLPIGKLDDGALMKMFDHAENIRPLYPQDVNATSDYLTHVLGFAGGGKSILKETMAQRG